MKNIKQFLFILIIVLISVGCHRDLGLDGPSGTYLYLNLTFPENENSEGGRFIHSEADELTVSLTYPGETAIEVTFELTSTSPGPILVEDLETGSDVDLYVSVGTGDVHLAEVSTTLDIESGANSPVSLTLKAIDYTVYGTLYDDADQILAAHTFTHNGVEVLTDSSGQFSLSLNTSGLVTSDYATFEIINSDTFELARTNLYLLQNRTDFSLKASPEIYLDFIVGCEQYALSGSSYEIWEGSVNVGTLIYSGTADSSGRILHQDTNYTNLGSHQIQLVFNDMFVPVVIDTNGAPGAVVADIIMDPYIIYPNQVGDNTNSIIRMEDMSGTGLETINTYILMQSLVSGINTVRLANLIVDYERNKMYVYMDYDASGVASAILCFDGWSDTTPDMIDVTSAIQVTQSSSFFGLQSVPQMTLLSDGAIIVATSNGVFKVDTVSNTISTVWETESIYTFVVNGVFESSDSNIYALGIDRLNDDNTDRQKIWLLNSDGSMTHSADLPAAYNAFPAVDLASGVSINASNYSYLMGLYWWNSRVVTLKTMNASHTGGEIVFLDGSGSDWGLDGSPINQGPSSVDLDYIIPLGILPDNKFYFVEEQPPIENPNWIIRIDDPLSNPTESYDFLYDGSGGEFQYYYSLIEPGS